MPGPVEIKALQRIPPAQPLDRPDQPAAKPALTGVRIGEAHGKRRLRSEGKSAEASSALEKEMSAIGVPVK